MAMAMMMLLVMKRRRSMQRSMMMMMRHVPFSTFFFIIFLLTSSSSSSSSSSCTEGTERGEACTLFQLKNSITVDPLNRLASWTFPNRTNNTAFFCQWEGVTCDARHHRHVVGMNMSGMGLVGSITPSLSNLTRLLFLDLSSNQLSGEIPHQLGLCSRLRLLNLCNNHLTTQIPGELGNLKHLEQLLLWGNQLSRRIPSTLSNCTSLIRLQIQDNNLIGAIPPELGNMKQLQYLVMWRNQLSGRIPSTLGNCTSLINLELDYNKLKGIIPSDLGNLKTLQNLSLSHNMLYGAIPHKIGEMVNLIGLYLDSNFLEGELPKELFNISRMQDLSLSKNHFNGSIPMGINCWPTLWHLDLSYNSFTSSIPSSFATLEGLNQLFLQHNMLAGTIPSELSKLGSLINLDLSSNKFSGTIPSIMGKIKSPLIIFNLSCNYFSGSIPRELGYLSELESLDLSYNNLSRIVPLELSQLKNLVVLNLSHNHLEGQIPSGAPFNNTTITNLEGNPQLCGYIVHRVCPPTIIEKRHIINTLQTKYIIMIVVLFLGIIAIPMVIWCYRLHSRKIHTRKGHAVSLELPVSPWLHVTENDLRMATDDFHINNIIGSGSFSIVYRGVLNYGKEIAVKLLNNEALGSYKSEAHFRLEVSNLGKLRHRNLIRVLGYCFNMDIKAIIFEYMRKGSLDGFLHGALNEVLTWEQRLKIIIGLANGLLYLHHEYPDGAMIHCDIKPSNVLLDDDLEPRLCDFGIAQLLEKNLESKPPSISTLLRGSLGYIPPEYAYTLNPSTSGDVYSFGVVIMEMVTCVRPTLYSIFENHGYDNLVAWVRGEHDPYNLLDPQLRESMDEMLGEKASHLLNISLLCTQEHPKKRPTMREVSMMLHTIGGL